MDEWQLAREALTLAGVAGAEDLGRFANDTRYFQPSAFDERAAMPVLLQLLPTLSDTRLVAAVAAHLRRPWARPVAFGPLVDAFRRWAPRNQGAGWQLGDALATAARHEDLPVLLSLAADLQYGTARQMIVDALWRFRKSPHVVTALVSLISDPDVALHAMSALRRSVGPAALPYLRQVEISHHGDRLGKTAASQIRRAESSASRRNRHPGT